MVGSRTGRAGLAAWLLILPLAAQSTPPSSPPARDFGRYLWTNFKGLASSENVTFLVAGASATGGLALLDKPVNEYWSAERRAPAFGSIGAVIGNPAVIGGIAGTMFWASYRGDNQRLRSMSFSLMQGTVIDTGISGLVKVSTHRLRPNGENYLSFTSGHASLTVMAATAVSSYYPRWTIPLYLVAAGVSVSRLEKNKHWLSDLAGGATQGFIIGRTVSRGAPAFRAKGFEVAPIVPAGGGVALALSIPLSRR